MATEMPLMPTLREIQTALLEALLGGALEDAGPYIAKAPVAWRLRIYRGNIVENFLRALASTYPVVEQLVGTDYFRQMAKDFHGRSPSRSGDLKAAGRAFPDYLGDLHRHDRFRYLADIARFEWLIQESSLAADHPPLDLARLAVVAPSTYEALGFTLHPTLRLFASPFPALSIWQANMADCRRPDVIDLAAGADRLAILRHRGELEFLRLNPGELAFLHSLSTGDCFSAALTHAQAADEGFDAPAVLRRFVSAAAIVDCSVPNR
jgi:hypothetical protein